MKAVHQGSTRRQHKAGQGVWEGRQYNGGRRALQMGARTGGTSEKFNELCAGGAGIYGPSSVDRSQVQ